LSCCCCCCVENPVLDPPKDELVGVFSENFELYRLVGFALLARGFEVPSILEILLLLKLLNVLFCRILPLPPLPMDRLLIEPCVEYRRLIAGDGV
jgi:hypothetical protein